MSWNVVLEKDGDQLDRSCEKWRSVTWSQGGQEYPRHNKRRKANCIGHILCRSWLLIHVVEGKRRDEKTWKKKQAAIGNQRILEDERGSTISNSLENSLLQRLWPCCKAECKGNEWTCMETRNTLTTKVYPIVPGSSRQRNIRWPLLLVVAGPFKASPFGVHATLSEFLKRPEAPL